MDLKSDVIVGVVDTGNAFCVFAVSDAKLSS